MCVFLNYYFGCKDTKNEKLMFANGLTNSENDFGK